MSISNDFSWKNSRGMRSNQLRYILANLWDIINQLLLSLNLSHTANLYLPKWKLALFSALSTLPLEEIISQAVSSKLRGTNSKSGTTEIISLRSFLNPAIAILVASTDVADNAEV